MKIYGLQYESMNMYGLQYELMNICSDKDVVITWRRFGKFNPTLTPPDVVSDQDLFVTFDIPPLTQDFRLQ